MFEQFFDEYRSLRKHRTSRDNAGRLTKEEQKYVEKIVWLVLAIVVLGVLAVIFFNVFSNRAGKICRPALLAFDLMMLLLLPMEYYDWHLHHSGSSQAEFRARIETIDHLIKKYRIEPDAVNGLIRQAEKASEKNDIFKNLGAGQATYLAVLGGLTASFVVMFVNEEVQSLQTAARMLFYTFVCAFILSVLYMVVKSLYYRYDSYGNLVDDLYAWMIFRKADWNAAENPDIQAEQHFIDRILEHFRNREGTG